MRFVIAFFKSVFVFFFSLAFFVFITVTTGIIPADPVPSWYVLLIIAASAALSFYSFNRSIHKSGTSRKKAVPTIGVYFFLLFLFIFGLFLFPVDSSNTSLAPGWYFYAMFVAPILGAVLYYHIPDNPVSSGSVESSPAPVKKSVSFRNNQSNIDAATTIAENYKKHISLAYSAPTVSAYYAATKRAKDDLSELKEYIGLVPDPLTAGIDRKEAAISENFQWKLRDSIEREKNGVITKIRGEYRNNKRGACESFVKNLESHMSDFDADTMQFCNEMLCDLVTKTSVPISFAGSPVTPAPDPIPDNMASNIFIIDRMTGEEFEQWSAQLLSDLGYKCVTLTKSSGDQGVDILAAYGDVRYAIQCKRYSSNVGNSPVQEVAAGMKFYGCNVGVVLTNQHFTTGARELADSIGICLWDRDWLERKIHERAMKDR